MDDRIIALLSKALNVDNSEIASLVKTEEGKELSKENITKIDELFQAKFEKIKENTKEEFSSKSKEIQDNFYKKGEKETREKVENEIKKEFGIESNKKGVDLVREVLSSKVKEIDKGDQLDEDKIKSSKTYLDAIEKVTKEKDAAIQEKEEEFNSFKENIERKETISKVKNIGREKIRALNPKLPEDKGIAERQMDLALMDLDDYDFEFQGDRVVVKKDGKIVEDKHSNPLKFEDLVTGIAKSTFELGKPKPDTPGSQGKADFEIEDDERLLDDKHYLEQIQNAKSPEEKRAIHLKKEELKKAKES